MGRIFEKIVKHKIAVLAAAAVIAAVCAVLMTRVEVNTDMTKYLPDDSNMKQGVSLMAEEFPDMENQNTIRVMFTGIDEKQADDVYSQLEDIKYVSDVKYDEESSDYVKDDKRLFVIVTPYDYESEEEEYIKAEVSSMFKDYDVAVKDDNANSSYIPVTALVIAIGFLVIIMLLMCASWLEPLLFLLTIGIAIVLNMGTNIFLDNVANITYAVAAILQLVLSMDYSIILSNRYRQEKPTSSGNVDAMTKALKKAFSSICSSSLTTFVGLLCLVFMSFKIGFNLGIVLAKGVICSLLCVVTVLPGLLLIFDGAVAKTAKKAADVPTDRIAGFEYRHRKAIAAFLVVVFAGAAVLQNFTATTFTLDYEDPIADVFQKTDQLAILYSNDDENKIPEITDSLSENENIKNVQCYYTELGREYTASKMAEKINEMSADAQLDEDTLKLMYYMYYDGSVSPMTLSEFADFLDDNISEDGMFSEYIDDDMKSSVDELKKFSDSDTLQSDMTIQQLADFFGMSESDVKDLFVLYMMENGGSSDVKMTLNQFADFVVNDVASDKRYGNMISQSQTAQLRSLQTLSDGSSMKKKRTAASCASVLGISRSQAELMMVYMYANDKSYAPPAVDIGTFVSFMNKDVMNNPALSSQVSEEQKQQLNMLAVYTDKDTVTRQLDAASLAGLSGMDETLVSQIMMMNGKSSMSLQELMSAVSTMQPENQEAASLNMIISAAVSGAEMKPEQMTQITGMDASDMRILYTYYDYLYGKTKFRCSVYEMVSYIDASGMDTTGQISSAKKIIYAGVSGKKFSAAEIAAFTGMKKSEASSLYTLYEASAGDVSGWKMSPAKFIDFAYETASGSYAGMIDSSQADQLKAAKTLIDTAVSGKEFMPADIAELFGDYSGMADENSIELLYLYKGAVNDSKSWWKMSIDQLFGFLSDDLVNDKRFTSYITDDFRQQIEDYKDQIADGRSQLIGDDYSIMLIETTYPVEGDETFGFISWLDGCFDGDHYLMGNSEMNYEMNEGFRHEMLMITLITALAIFLVVALTFRSALIPLILVLLVQCGVWLTVSYIGVSGNSIYYLAMLIVQCILMGATIDYAILYTSYYIENRKHLDIQESMKKAYRGSIHTILTSGLIICIVTLILSYTYGDPSVEQICRTISTGAMFAILLILFVLPAVLACLDKAVMRKRT